ncbi:MAG: UDP-glucose 4-epimerase GalE [Candidatus Gastranaerophilales bacterium]|nr:UDP-glucose 4-epimerase GalE [Candidatus Gastranaerophilales bacterium]
MILVTGGAGYIGSHCVLSLLENKQEVVVFDNLSTGFQETIDELKKIGNLKFIKGDLSKKEDLNSLFENYKIDSVFHFAAFSQVKESVLNPQKYYSNNVSGTINLLEAMIKNNVKKIVFSSTAAIYGEVQYVPIDEKHIQKPMNPYGKTKLMIENILDDYDNAYGVKSVRLRYFNVVGADIKKRIGERHNPETHLIPNVLKSTFNDARPFEIYGNDYNTKDGTCIRDYINIEDLIDAHLKALKYLENGGKTDFFNLGNAQGYSVKEVFEICKKVTEKDIQFNINKRREGDPEKLVADNKKAKEILNWNPKRNLEYGIKAAYEWEKKLQGGLKNA